MPYNIPVLNELVKEGFDITVVSRNKRRKSSYVIPDVEGIVFLDEDDFNKHSLLELAKEIDPVMMFVCDWSVKKYNRCALYARRELKIPVVVGSDTQWMGGKQWLNVFTSMVRHQQYFSHMLVAGMRQFEYGKKLGFRNEQILTHLYSADVDKFQKRALPEIGSCNRNFLFVGRFVKDKSVDLLIEAWRAIEDKKGATLTLVGEGPLKESIEETDGIILKDFMSQDELLELAEKSCCFILPSRFEPWALVLHEFAAAGLPIIASTACGATPYFVVSGYNGYTIEPGSVKEIKDKIEKVIGLESTKLAEFSERSRKLSRKIEPAMVAKSLISVLE